MANELHHNSTKRGGDRRSEKARAEQAARRPSLVVEIAEWRQRLDQSFYDHLHELRRLHGDAVVDQALATLQRQRDQVSAAPRKEPERRGPNHFRREKFTRLAGE